MEMEEYRWVADPLPPETPATGYYVGGHAVDYALGGKHGHPDIAEGVAGSCGASLRTVRRRLEQLVLEGKVEVRQVEIPTEAFGPHILMGHFTEALREARRADFYRHAAEKAHIEAHHGGDISDAFGEEGWTCDVCLALAEQSNALLEVGRILLDGETEAASHFDGEVARAQAQERR